MSLLHRRKHKERKSGPKMRLNWRQRARIVGVPKSARDLLEQLESRATSEPGYVEHVADIVRELEDEPAMLTLGLFQRRNTPSLALWSWSVRWAWCYSCQRRPSLRRVPMADALSFRCEA